MSSTRRRAALPQQWLGTSTQLRGTSGLRLGSPSDPMASLWATEGAFRLITLVYALYIHVTAVQHYTRPHVASALILGQCVWSALVAWALFSWPKRRAWLVLSDLAVTAALILSTWFVSPESWWDHNQSLPTTMWATNAVLCAGMRWGIGAGTAAGAGVGLTSLLVGGDLSWLERSPTLPILVSAGMAAGVGSLTVKRSHEQLSLALEVAARTAERERLAREVHDGVLQALALVARRGPALGEEGVELGALAAEQERRLRDLIADREESRRSDTALVHTAPDTEDTGESDLRLGLLPFASERVTVSAGQDAVMLPSARGEELLAVVRQALANAERHAGPHARVFILLEDEGSDVRVTVRDDGVGMDPDRPAAAEAEGRMGVSRSIRGRIADLAGTAHLDAAPGEGTEWEFLVPKQGPERRH